MTRHGRHITLLPLLLAAGLLLAGPSCSSSKLPPQPAAESTAQRKEAQAARLQSLAAEVAKEVQGAVLQREELLNVPIFMRPPHDTSFSQTFSQLLASELVKRGLSLSVAQEDALVLDYGVQDNVVLTVTLRYNNRYVLHTSKVAYTGDQGLGGFAKDAVWNRFAKRRPVYSP